VARRAGKGATLIVTGVDKVDRKLRKLGPAVQKKVVRAAMRKGMNLVTAEARKNAPVKTGALKKAIKTRGSSRPKKGVVRVETRVGAGDFKGETFYAAMVEFGTSHAPPHPYMTPAYEAKKDEARAAAIAAILAGVEREARGGAASSGRSAAGRKKAGKGRRGGSSKWLKGARKSGKKLRKAAGKKLGKFRKALSRRAKKAVKQARKRIRRPRKAGRDAMGRFRKG
jgi:HK97 gp10 family phage protein